MSDGAQVLPVIAEVECVAELIPGLQPGERSEFFVEEFTFIIEVGVGHAYVAAVTEPELVGV